MPELISQTMIIGLAIAVVVGMAAILNVVRTDTQENIAQAMAENICHQVKLTAEQLQPSSQPSVVRLALPNKIGGEPYSIRATGYVITVTTIDANHTCTAGTYAQLSGVATGTLKLTSSASTITLSNA